MAHPAIMSTTQYLIDATGLVALYLNVRGLVRPCDRTLRQTTGIAAFLWALNNFLLGAHAAAALSVVSAGRQVSATAVQRSTQRKRLLACAGFMLLSLVVGMFTWHGPTTVFTLSAVLLSTYAMFYMQAVQLRMAMLLVSVLWMANAFAFDSLEQMAANLATAVAAIIGARRSQDVRQAMAGLPSECSSYSLLQNGPASLMPRIHSRVVNATGRTLVACGTCSCNPGRRGVEDCFIEAAQVAYARGHAGYKLQIQSSGRPGAHGRPRSGCGHR